MQVDRRDFLKFSAALATMAAASKATLWPAEAIAREFEGWVPRFYRCVEETSGEPSGSLDVNTHEAVLNVQLSAVEQPGTGWRPFEYDQALWAENLTGGYPYSLKFSVIDSQGNVAFTIDGSDILPPGPIFMGEDIEIKVSSLTLIDA